MHKMILINAGAARGGTELALAFRRAGADRGHVSHRNSRPVQKVGRGGQVRVHVYTHEGQVCCFEFCCFGFGFSVVLSFVLNFGFRLF